MFALLLAPSYLVALGWERLLEPQGVLDTSGIHPDVVRTLFYGPFGVVFVLAMKGLPFAYLAISSALRELGEEFEDAVRVHGGGRIAAIRVVIALLAPAIWSALAIVFAESVSDFGVAATLANDAHFPVATYTLFNSVEAFPIQFPVAAAVGWVLMGLAGIALLAQSWALRSRSYRVLSGRSRPARRIHLSPGARRGALGGLTLLLVLGLGVPVFAAVAASLIDNLGTLLGSHGLTLSNYSDVLTNGDVRYALLPPLLYSAQAAAITATIAVVLGAVVARLLTRSGAHVSARLLDLLLLTAVALPGIVFAAGYIFTYNQPVLSHIGLRLYGTTALLILGYVATALPATSRVLVGTVSQVQELAVRSGAGAWQFRHGGVAAYCASGPGPAADHGVAPVFRRDAVRAAGVGVAPRARSRTALGGHHACAPGVLVLAGNRHGGRLRTGGARRGRSRMGIVPSLRTARLAASSDGSTRDGHNPGIRHNAQRTRRVGG